MDERLLRTRDVEERVAGGRHLPEPRPDDKQHVRLAHTGSERRVDTDADVTRVHGRVVVECVLTPERRARRQRVVLEEHAQVVGGTRRPARAADDRERPLGRREQRGERLEIRRCRAGLDDLEPRRVVDVARRREHVLG